uniref:GH16 domain-containing protein n=1 Tax=Oryza barthii TaxID=65489 RepID=A0A0D3HJX8_9ORYZ
MVASAKAMLPSGEDKHNEFDLEFLGNVTGEPYLVQTNLYIDSVDNREQCIDLCFDPIADFHTYVVLWNPSQVVFLVDDTPIRVYKNKNATAIKLMSVYSSIWNADDWAMQGGRVKTDRSHAPFVAMVCEVCVEGRVCSERHRLGRRRGGAVHGELVGQGGVPMRRNWKEEKEKR